MLMTKNKKCSFLLKKQYSYLICQKMRAWEDRNTYLLNYDSFLHRLPKNDNYSFRRRKWKEKQILAMLSTRCSLRTRTSDWRLLLLSGTSPRRSAPLEWKTNSYLFWMVFLFLCRICGWWTRNYESHLDINPIFL